MLYKKNLLSDFSRLREDKYTQSMNTSPFVYKSGQALYPAESITDADQNWHESPLKLSIVARDERTARS